MCKMEILYFLPLFLVANVLESKVVEVSVNIGRNLTVPCPIHQTQDVMWVKEGKKIEQPSRTSILENGSLFITQVDRNDSGVYVCSRENVVSKDEDTRVRVKVKTPPPALKNVIVRPSTILVNLIWEVHESSDCPIINFTAQYRLAFTNDTWIPISPNHITPNSRQVEVFKLIPNTTYQFRIWSTNQIGRSPITEVYGTTLDVYKEQDLARHLLQGADKFDTRVWAVAVGIVMGTLILLGLGTCFLLYQECRIPGVVEEQEIIELVPNIILNPGFEPNLHHDQMPDENSNSETPLRLNNNTVVQPNVIA